MGGCCCVLQDGRTLAGDLERRMSGPKVSYDLMWYNHTAGGVCDRGCDPGVTMRHGTAAGQEVAKQDTASVVDWVRL